MKLREFLRYHEPLVTAQERGCRRSVLFVACVLVAGLAVRDCGMATERDHFVGVSKMVEGEENEGHAAVLHMRRVFISDPVGDTGRIASARTVSMVFSEEGIASWYGHPYHGRRSGEQRAVEQGEGNGIQHDSTGLHLSVSNSSSLHPNSRPYGNTGEHPVGHVPVQYGYASWYGTGYHGRPVACQPGPDGKQARYDMNAMTAAHRTLPCWMRARVCRTDREACVVVRINDRGPFIQGRVVDLSRAAMERIGGINEGVVPVTLEEMP